MLESVSAIAEKVSDRTKGGVTIKRQVSREIAQQLKSMQAVSSSLSHLSSKVKLTANIGGKEFSANGNVKIKRGEGMLISVNALGGLILTEAGGVGQQVEDCYVIFCFAQVHQLTGLRNLCNMNIFKFRQIVDDFIRK